MIAGMTDPAAAHVTPLLVGLIAPEWRNTIEGLRFLNFAGLGRQPTRSMTAGPKTDAMSRRRVRRA